jgi:uncharacterized Ntn-hydrolase superfamily protein
MMSCAAALLISSGRLFAQHEIMSMRCICSCARGRPRCKIDVRVKSARLTFSVEQMRISSRIYSCVIGAVAFVAVGCAPVTVRPPSLAPLPETGTFSIIAYDTATGEWGGAVQSRVFSVGNGVLSAEAGVGVVATQAVVDVSYGPQALALLRQGKSASEVVKSVWAHDPDPDTARWAKSGRQFAIVDAKGNVAAYTGPTAQGNTLASKAVTDSMVAAFNRTPGHLAFRLLAGIEAGQAAGGDRRGMQSAAMIIVKKCGGVWLHNDIVLKLQVDDSPAPIAELRRLVEKAPLPPRSVTNATTDPACR